MTDEQYALCELVEAGRQLPPLEPEWYIEHENWGSMVICYANCLTCNVTISGSRRQVEEAVNQHRCLEG